MAYNIKQNHAVFRQAQRLGDARDQFPARLKAESGNLAALALSEAYGMTGSQRYKDAAQAAIRIAVDEGRKTRRQDLMTQMAVAVLLDATIIRMVLVPAFMQLAGGWNWWPGGRKPPKAS